MKHILVALDIGPSSDRAFDRAVQLAEAHEAHLTLIHVIDEQMLAYGSEADRFEVVLRNRAEAKLGRYRRDMREELAGRFRHMTRIGAPWQEVALAASEAKADLIVLGLHHRDSIRDLFIGTTAERIIRNSATPILAVTDKPSGAYQRVTAATDFSPCSSRALRAALDLVPSADFELLHVFDAPFAGFARFSRPELDAYKQRRIDEAERQIQRDLDVFLQSHAAAGRPKIAVSCKRGEIVGGIHSAIRDGKADLLALGTHSRSAIVGSVLGSIAATFLANPPCDVLVAP